MCVWVVGGSKEGHPKEMFLIKKQLICKMFPFFPPLSTDLQDTTACAVLPTVSVCSTMCQ